METSDVTPLPEAPISQISMDPPWVQDRPRPRAVAARVAAPERIHWSVAVLTALTALSILVQGYGRHTAPKELLPIVVEAR